MKGYDVIGNIAVVKFDRADTATSKKKEALTLLKKHNNIQTVLEKVGKFKGRLRTLKTNFIAGKNTKECLYKENGCLFRLNIDTCYFSPRLASERLEVSQMVKRGESVLVLFGGVAPFAIVIAKHSKANKVTSVELSRACSKYALENVRRNKLIDKVSVVQGDVRKVLPKMKDKFDRIVMARPNLADSFLDCAYPRVKKGGILHYYGFYEETALEEMKLLLEKEAKKAKRKIKILNVKKAGDIGKKKYRYRADVEVLN